MTRQLFPSKPYLSERARYPRGYTPARLKAVQQTTGLDPQWHGGDGAAEVAGVRDNLARSTAPIEHMEGVRWLTESRSLHGDSGMYEPPLGSQSPTIHLAPGEARGGTPLHELGHHVSHEVAATLHSAYSTHVQQGQEEAYAENYAERHFRDRRGRPETRLRRRAEDWTGFGQRGGRFGGFHEGWREERSAGSPILHAMNERVDAFRARTRLARIHEQMELF